MLVGGGVLVGRRERPSGGSEIHEWLRKHGALKAGAALGVM